MVMNSDMCVKCNKEALYIDENFDPSLKLCFDHMPKKSTDTLEKVEKRVIKLKESDYWFSPTEKTPLKECFVPSKDYENPYSDTTNDECWFCGKPNSPLRKYSSAPRDLSLLDLFYTKPSIPVDPFCVYVCDRCWNYGSRSLPK